MLRQKLLLLWADYWWHHLTKIMIKGVAGLVLFSGAAAPVIVASPIHFKSRPHPPAAVTSAPKKVVTAVPAHKSPAPAPPPSTPAPAATTTPTPAPTPAPKPFSATTPAPGSGAKKLAAAPAPASSPPPSGGSSTPSSPSSGGSFTPATGGYTSTNWAGYVATAGGYTAVSGAWNVPSATGNGSTTTADSSWIGIGGVFSNDLIQTGTENIVSASGSVHTAAFYEILPDVAQEIPSLTVSAGDQMTASITEGTPGSWSVTITDSTTGQSYTTTLSYTSTHSSAEWIEEDPSYADGSQVPFDTFSNANFSGSTATAHGTTASIAGNNGQPITMVSSVTGQPIAIPSVLTAAGNGFSVAHS